MGHPKSLYRFTKDGMEEMLAMTQEEEWEYAYKKGWYPHPEEARLAPFIEEEPEEKKKPGRPKKC